MEEMTVNIDTSVSVITKITYLLFLFLILAIFVERCVEVFMSILKYADLKLGWYKFWNKQAERFKLKYDHFYRLQGSNTDDKKMLFSWILWDLVTEKPYEGGKQIIAAKAIRTQYYRIISRGFAFILSLIFSVWVYKVLHIDLVDILQKVANTEVLRGDMMGLKIFLTAAILAAGSEPMHQLITKVEKVGESKKNKAS